MAASAGCVVNEPDRAPPRASAPTELTSAEISTDTREVDVHVSPEVAARCGTSTLRGIALCMTHGPLRGEKVQLVGRIVEGDGAEGRTEHALARAERVRRYLLDQGVHPGRVVASAGVNGDVARREPHRVDLTLVP